MTEELAIKLRNIPLKPGVYQFLSDRGEVLYVGKAVRLRNRVRQYFQKGYERDPRLKVMVGKIADVEIIVTDTEVEALILETNLIKERKPKYNVDLKDDKSYPYIVITNEPYPRVFATRRIIRDGSRYFGPFTDVRSMHESLKLIRDTYRIRSCNYFIDREVIEKKKIKVCLDYHIKKCDGPCEGLIGGDCYAAMIREVGQILRGKTGSLVGEIAGRMEKAASEMRFEEAAELRDRMRALEVHNQRQKVVDTELVDRDLVALAIRDDDGCGVVFRIRDGKITGKQHFFLSSVRGRNEAGVLEEFLGNYFLGTEDIPREVFLPLEIEHADILGRYLSGKKGGRVGIVVPKIGEKAKLMQMCRKNADLFLNMLLLQKEHRREKSPPSVELLKRDLGMQGLPKRIECFDISHIQGSDTVGSMVVFTDGRPRRSEYRKFKLGSGPAPDDYASMREIVRRRYTGLLQEQGILPDLIVIDGGKGQLSSALETLSELGLWNEGGPPADARGQVPVPGRTTGGPVAPLTVIGLAKRLEEVYLPGHPDPQSIQKDSPGLKLLQRIRNEAHRFAVTYHRKRRSMRTLQTELELIEGVGKKRAKDLLEVFGSVQGVRFATADQLSEIVGESASSSIRRYFDAGGELVQA